VIGPVTRSKPCAGDYSFLLLIATLSCAGCWSFVAPWDVYRCEPGCPSDKVCFNGECISRDAGSSDQQLKDATVDQRTSDLSRDLSLADAGLDQPAPDLGPDQSSPDLPLPDLKLDLPAEASTGSCGDNKVTGTEQCDGSNLAGESCVSKNYTGGNLSCKADCTFDYSDCHKCGDGKKHSAEKCEGTDVGGQTCITQGFGGGALACDGSCQLDTKGCYKCGDSKVNASEQCDGLDLNSKTCVDQGFQGGTLACKQSCVFDTSGCYDCNHSYTLSLTAPNSFGYGAGYLWASDNDTKKVYKIDVTTGVTLSSFTPLAGATPYGVTYLAGSIWVVIYPQGTLMQFDTNGNLIGQCTNLGGNWRGLATDGVDLYLVGGTMMSEGLKRVKTDCTELAFCKPPFLANDATWMNGSLWVMSGTGFLVAIDATTCNTSFTTNIGEISPVAFGGGCLWRKQGLFLISVPPP
jgi:hypothetical protein